VIQNHFRIHYHVRFKKNRMETIKILPRYERCNAQTLLTPPVSWHKQLPINMITHHPPFVTHHLLPAIHGKVLLWPIRIQQWSFCKWCSVNVRLCKAATITYVLRVWDILNFRKNWELEIAFAKNSKWSLQQDSYVLKDHFDYRSAAQSSILKT